MKSIRFLSVFLVFGALAGLTLGCGGGPSDEELALAGLQEQLGVVQQDYEKLQALRTEIVTSKATVTEIEAISEKKRTDEQKAQLEELSLKLAELGPNAEEAHSSLQDQLSELLDKGLNEFPQSPQTAGALKIYSDELILVAEDMVVKSGDYKKAIDRLEGAKKYYLATEKPVYPALEEEIATLKDWSLVTKDRFDALNKGMTMDEVKATVGFPYYRNIRDDEKLGVQIWRYGQEGGGAAEIYFKIKNGKMYSTKWDAVKTRVVTD